MEKEKKETLLLLDANSIIHRAFHALPPLKNREGEDVGAIYGSLLAFFSIIDKFKPTYIIAAFDSPAKTFRHKKYKEYKAKRPKAKEELICQIKAMRDVFKRIGVFVFAKEGLEADDIIGSAATSFSKKIEIVIASGDKDVFQLVDDSVKIHSLRRGIKDTVLYSKEDIEKKFDNLSPEKIVDIKALQGDASDNIPGVSGIGEKTAIKIIKEFGNIENLYKELEKGESGFFSKKIEENLKREKEKAFLSKELVTIKRDAPFNFSLSDLYFNYNRKNLEKVLREMGFNNIANKVRGEEEKEKENRRLNF